MEFSSTEEKAEQSIESFLTFLRPPEFYLINIHAHVV